MIKKNNKPEIRFKGFTDEWEQRELGEISSLITKGTTPLDKSNIGTVNFIKIESIDNSSGKITITQKISSEEHEGDLRRSQLKENDILFSIAGTLGRVTLVTSSILPANTNQALAIIRLKSGCLKYVKEYLKGKAVADFIKKNPTIGAQPNLSLEQVSNLKIALPSEIEQEQIGIFFETLDNLITLHQHKYDKYKNIKNALLEKMFPKKGKKIPGIRFKGFTDDWEQRKLGEFGKSTGGTSLESEFSESGKYKVISIGSYSENSTYNDQGIRAVKSDKTSNRILNKNDLTMILNDKTTSGNIIGRVLLIEESGVYVYNQRTERIEINLDKYNPVFLYEMLNAQNIRKKIIKQAQGNTQIYVNWSTIESLDYMVPSKEEQAKIGAYFKNLDNLITLHQRKYNLYKKYNKILFKKIFYKEKKWKIT